MHFRKVILFKTCALILIFNLIFFYLSGDIIWKKGGKNDNKLQKPSEKPWLFKELSNANRQKRVKRSTDKNTTNDDDDHDDDHDDDRHDDHDDDRYDDDRHDDDNQSTSDGIEDNVLTPEMVPEPDHDNKTVSTELPHGNHTMSTIDIAKSKTIKKRVGEETHSYGKRSIEIIGNQTSSAIPISQVGFLPTQLYQKQQNGFQNNVVSQQVNTYSRVKTVPPNAINASFLQEINRLDELLKNRNVLSQAAASRHDSTVIHSYSASRSDIGGVTQKQQELNHVMVATSTKHDLSDDITCNNSTCANSGQCISLPSTKEIPFKHVKCQCRYGWSGKYCNKRETLVLILLLVLLTVLATGVLCCCLGITFHCECGIARKINERAKKSTEKNLTDEQTVTPGKKTVRIKLPPGVLKNKNNKPLRDKSNEKNTEKTAEYLQIEKRDGSAHAHLSRSYEKMDQNIGQLAINSCQKFDAKRDGEQLTNVCSYQKSDGPRSQISEWSASRELLPKHAKTDNNQSSFVTSDDSVVEINQSAYFDIRDQWVEENTRRQEKIPGEDELRKLNSSWSEVNTSEYSPIKSYDGWDNPQGFGITCTVKNSPKTSTPMKQVF